MVVYASPVFSVDVEQFTLPNRREIAMIRQYRHAVARDLLELPAGSVDESESPEVAAARECEEEIGEVPARVERLGALYPPPGYCDEEMIFFRVSGLQAPPADSPHRPDDAEDIATRAMFVAESKGMVARGEIVDLKTAYALTLL